MSDGDVAVAVFDLGGVACRFEPDRRVAALARATGLARGAIEAAIWASGLDAAFDRGDFDLDGAVHAVLDALDHRLGRAELLEAWAEAFRVDNDVIATVRRLPCRSAMLTNNGPLLEECLRLEVVDLQGAFDPVLFAWCLGAAKPDRRAFQRAASHLQVPASRLLLIDDSAVNVRAAIDSGWQAILYQPAILESSLQNLGLR